MAKAKTSKKKGQNEKSAKAYIASGAYEVNKARKLFRHLRRFPGDNKAIATLKALSTAAVNKARATFTQPVMVI